STSHLISPRARSQPVPGVHSLLRPGAIAPQRRRTRRRRRRFLPPRSPPPRPAAPRTRRGSSTGRRRSARAQQRGESPWRHRIPAPRAGAPMFLVPDRRSLRRLGPDLALVLTGLPLTLLAVLVLVPLTDRKSVV